MAMLFGLEGGGDGFLLSHMMLTTIWGASEVLPSLASCLSLAIISSCGEVNATDTHKHTRVCVQHRVIYNLHQVKFRIVSQLQNVGKRLSK